MDSLINTHKINSPDMVNHPKHYADGKHEVIDVMIEYFGSEWTETFCIMNAFKYLSRCKKKHKLPNEDIKKAKWYIDKCIELISLDELKRRENDKDPDWDC